MGSNKDKTIPLINRKILVVGMMVIAIGIFLIIISPQSKVSLLIDKTAGNAQSPHDAVGFITMNEGKKATIYVLKKDLLFNVTAIYDNNNQFKSLIVEKKPELYDFYKQVGFANASEDVVFVYPLFTQAAYGDHGFYDYYNKKCSSECLTLHIPSMVIPTYSSSISISKVLTILNYSHVTDVDVDKNPDILNKYRKVIILHNEYVTKREFDAITNHPNVIYLFPNALYAEVKTNYTNNTFTLIRGHGYPIPSIANGFDWKFDNSNLEYNTICENMTFDVIPNGKMLNCYPAYRSLFDKSFLEAIKDS